MGNYSGTTGDSSKRQSPADTDGPVCPVCKGRKYILVASRKLNSSSTVYDRQTCQACADVENTHYADRSKLSSQAGKKELSGTGYLRNKKRRRKEAS